VEAFGGRYDAVIAAEEIEGPAVGAVVQLESWLIGSFENG
jgi:hypothetical protein